LTMKFLPTIFLSVLTLVGDSTINNDLSADFLEVFFADFLEVFFIVLATVSPKLQVLQFSVVLRISPLTIQVIQ